MSPFNAGYLNGIRKAAEIVEGYTSATAAAEHLHVHAIEFEKDLAGSTPALLDCIPVSTVAIRRALSLANAASVDRASLDSLVAWVRGLATQLEEGK